MTLIPTADEITLSDSHGLAVGDMVTYRSPFGSGDSTGLADGTTYEVTAVNGAAIELSENGSVVDLSQFEPFQTDALFYVRVIDSDTIKLTTNQDDALDSSNTTFVSLGAAAVSSGVHMIVGYKADAYDSMAEITVSQANRRRLASARVRRCRPSKRTKTA